MRSLRSSDTNFSVRVHIGKFCTEVREVRKYPGRPVRTRLEQGCGA